MEQRLANTWHMSINEKKFIETALLSDLRTDGRRPFDYRELTIKFGRKDGSTEVQLGQTHVMSFVTAQLVQPYRDRPNEGSLNIYTEFSPMADPSFEAGRPGESAIELGRIIDRGLRCGIMARPHHGFIVKVIELNVTVIIGRGSGSGSGRPSTSTMKVFQ